MKAVRVTEEWQRAGVHYVRTQAMCLGFKIPLEGEFSENIPEKLSAWQHWNPIGENITDRQGSLRRKTGCAKKV